MVSDAIAKNCSRLCHSARVWSTSRRYASWTKPVVRACVPSTRTAAADRPCGRALREQSWRQGAAFVKGATQSNRSDDPITDGPRAVHQTRAGPELAALLQRYLMTMSARIGPRMASSSSFSFCGTPAPSSAFTKSSTSASKSASVIPMPWWAAFMSSPA